MSRQVADATREASVDVRDRTLDGVLGAIGGTPLVRLSRLFEDATFTLFGKLEALNPGGSMKDRPALQLLRAALARGDIGTDTTVVESSSGNMAVGLAQVCAYLGLRMICVADPKLTSANRALLRAYGAEISLVSERDAATGEYLPARIRRVEELCRTLPNAFWPNQYANLDHPAAHRITASEIFSALGDEPNYIFCPVSTCGLLRGCRDYVREVGAATTLVAVDAVGSVIFGGQPSRRAIPGHGAAVRPALFAEGLADEVVFVSEADCVRGCRRLARREAILAGGSSGAVVAAIDAYGGRLPVGACCVAVLPDRGERYLDTIYSDAWVAEHIR